MDTDPSPEEPEAGPAKAPTNITSALPDFLAARIELASIEAKEAASFTGKKIVCGLALGIVILLVWCLLLAGITGILGPVADQWLAGKADWLPGWAAVMIALALIHGTMALILLSALRKAPVTPLFELSRREIENDKQWLQKNKQTK